MFEQHKLLNFAATLLLFKVGSATNKSNIDQEPTITHRIFETYSSFHIK